MSQHTTPRNFREVLQHLERYPRVRITGPTPDSREAVTREEDFCCFVDGRLWFQPTGRGEPHFIPVGCALTPAAARAEPGVMIDEAGFTVTMFRVPIRVEYLP